MKTYSAKPTEIKRAWYILDAGEAPLGRVATKAAVLLLGKEKPRFTKHVDCGDYVIIVNAENTQVTGDKMNQKKYYHHSNYPGGLTELALSEKMKKDPTHALYHAIRGMLPDNKLRDGRLKRLKIYANKEHVHDPQKPIKISIKRGN